MSYIQSSDGERSAFLKEVNCYIANLFRALGLPAVQAPGEAEAMCAALQRRGVVAACATKDSDALVFGATKVVHTINLQVGRLSTCICCPWALEKQAQPESLCENWL